MTAPLGASAPKEYATRLPPRSETHASHGFQCLAAGVLIGAGSVMIYGFLWRMIVWFFTHLIGG